MAYLFLSPTKQLNSYNVVFFIEIKGHFIIFTNASSKEYLHTHIVLNQMLYELAMLDTDQVVQQFISQVFLNMLIIALESAKDGTLIFLQ